ncbi:hypothetical protein A3A46_01880 [Candidatus Roizmanbacteria bacterium RIFCSPLOWO2_01_FULL_37_13]|uniref:ROK family protein n=1 Tax=Candidatus Roizmanbacteria bacterium RIFCSPHIGHO2_02_FULL_38_11 TaxID=1802039 RepID=A0A1F7H0D9_9BACT|nr:MAG: hypothetical protein A3C25_05740 [Candidatus Roizmanbacteria bacterium RIFCSPHIGHO2_02_FULL_38_11]OGK42973.1 MAG: hypothetical protein A3A46_01880 [Candidatus Roizmanbacteria bacterium RIFCSPLOWO2_01_FULL_37_13]
MYLGIDIGGTNIRIGAFEKSNPSELKGVSNFEVSQDFNLAIKNIIAQIKKSTQGKKIYGIGVGAPGLINRKEGHIEKSANLPKWQKKPIGKILEKEFNTEVKVENDVAVAATGKALYGHGKSVSKFIYLIWGTGFGGAVVEKINGKLKITSIEPGHQILDWNGIDCACGQKGCLEPYIGGRATEKHYGKPLIKVNDEKT